MGPYDRRKLLMHMIGKFLLVASFLCCLLENPRLAVAQGRPAATNQVNNLSQAVNITITKCGPDWVMFQAHSNEEEVNTIPFVRLNTKCTLLNGTCIGRAAAEKIILEKNIDLLAFQINSSDNTKCPTVMSSPSVGTCSLHFHTIDRNLMADYICNISIMNELTIGPNVTNNTSNQTTTSAEPDKNNINAIVAQESTTLVAIVTILVCISVLLVAVSVVTAVLFFIHCHVRIRKLVQRVHGTAGCGSAELMAIAMDSSTMNLNEDIWDKNTVYDGTDSDHVYSLLKLSDTSRTRYARSSSHILQDYQCISDFGIGYTETPHIASIKLRRNSA